MTMQWVGAPSAGIGFALGSANTSPGSFSIEFRQLSCSRLCAVPGRKHARNVGSVARKRRSGPVRESSVLIGDHILVAKTYIFEICEVHLRFCFLSKHFMRIIAEDHRAPCAGLRLSARAQGHEQ